jgi:hypothetical protein
MQAGQEGLTTLYNKTKKDKSLSKNELNQVENALINLAGFSQYKLDEFKKKK